MTASSSPLAGQASERARTGTLLNQVAGYAALRTVDIGLRRGLFDGLAAHQGGLTPAGLAAAARLDPVYVEVWCRSAYAAGVLEANGDAYRLDPVTATLLLDRDSPAYLGGLVTLIQQPEMFDGFSDRLPTGERTWWDRFTPEFIQAVAQTSRPSYIRLIPAGLSRVPGLREVLHGEPDVLELACGTGFGLVRLAETYRRVRLVGVDGDAYSLELAARRLEEAGQDDRVDLVLSTLEDLDRAEGFDLALTNLSMHECRDIDKVTDNIRRALRHGGYFVISDFPFPDTSQALRTVPGQIMAAIQLVEAQIGDQLLPTHAYAELLERHGFTAVGSFELTPLHAVTHGRK